MAKTRGATDKVSEYVDQNSPVRKGTITKSPVSVDEADKRVGQGRTGGQGGRGQRGARGGLQEIKEAPHEKQEEKVTETHMLIKKN